MCAAVLRLTPAPPGNHTSSSFVAATRSRRALIPGTLFCNVYFVTRLRSCSALFLLPPGFLFPPRRLFVGRMTQNRWTETWMEDRYQTRIEVTELIQFVLLSLLPSFHVLFKGFMRLYYPASLSLTRVWLWSEGVALMCLTPTLNDLTGGKRFPAAFSVQCSCTATKSFGSNSAAFYST